MSFVVQYTSMIQVEGTLKHQQNLDQPQVIEQPRRLDRGVMCLMTVKISGQEKVVLMTVPSEDTELQKSERLSQMVEMIEIDSEMLTFAGGKIEAGEHPSKSLSREMWEEAELHIHPNRFERIKYRPFGVTQEVKSEKSSRNGVRDFEVTGFRCEITQAELQLMKERLEKQGRSVCLYSWEEVALLTEKKIRPSSRGLIKEAISSEQIKFQVYLWLMMLATLPPNRS